MQKTIWARLIALTTAIVMALLPFHSPAVQAAEAPTISEERADELAPILKAIEEIPDELLEKEDPDAIKAYFLEKDIDMNVVEQAPPATDGMVETQGAWDCSLAIAEIVVLNAIPVARIAKIKKYIKDLGGYYETAKLLVGATNAGEKFAALSALIAELSGFTKVKKDCNL